MIVGTFHITLTQKQGARIRAKWSKYGQDRGMMLIAQPVAQWGPFQIKYGFLNCAILDRKTASKIHRVIEKAKHEKPA